MLICVYYGEKKKVGVGVSKMQDKLWMTIVVPFGFFFVLAHLMPRFLDGQAANKSSPKNPKTLNVKSISRFIALFTHTNIASCI